MHEPGPPRTTSVGRSVELAPRDPDPDGTYRWRLLDAPTGSDAERGDIGGMAAEPTVLVPGETTRDDDPVVHVHPDTPGEYVFALDAPDGVHRQRVRVFPDERHETTIRVPTADLPLPDADVDRVSVMWRHNERLLARDRPEREGDEWVLRSRVPPGRHGVSFLANDDRATGHRLTHEVPGPGRPRVSLDVAVETVPGGPSGAGSPVPDGRDGTDTEALVVEAEVGVPPGSETDPETVDVEFLVDDRDADPETVARIEERASGHRLVVPLDELPVHVTGAATDAESAADRTGLRIHAVPHAERRGAAATVRIDGGDAGLGDETALECDRLTATDPHARPAWADAATIYEVYVRSFAGDTLSTTFAEIERRIPYVESLGVDVLWLTPVLASPTEHGYHVTDYTDTADDLGSRVAFESLVAACHDAGIRVVFDLVINHTSRDHPAFQLHTAGVPAYRDHYRRTDAAFDVTDIEWAALDSDDMPEYYFNWGRIPNLNFDSPAVRSWLLDIVDDWASVVDGFRADVAWGIPHGFWKEVADRVPEDLLLLDETLPHDPFYGEGEFHLHYDTSLYEALRRIGAGDAPASAVADALDRGVWLGFDDPGAQMRYVENHDEPRYLAEYGEAAARAAVAVTFTLPGSPMVYAGGERGNETTRGPFRWHDGDNALTEFHRALSRLRDARPLLRADGVDFDDGAAAVTVTAGDADRVVAYERLAENGGDNASGDVDSGDASGAVDSGVLAGDAEGPERLLVVVNFADDPATVAVPDGIDHDLFAAERDEGDGRVDGSVVVDTLAVLV